MASASTEEWNVLHDGKALCGMQALSGLGNLWWYGKMVLRDLGKMAKGCVALVRYAFTKDNISVCLSLFSAESAEAKSGVPNEYEVLLMNNGDRSLVVKLLIDVYLRTNPVHPDGHHGYFEKMIFLSPHKMHPVMFVHDWISRSSFKLEDVSFEPDNGWRGDCRAPGVYSLSAVLLGSEGKPLDRLMLIQELKP